MTDVSLCNNCRVSLDELLASIPELLDDLNITMSRQARTAERVGSHSAEVPMPYHLLAAMVYRELADELAKGAWRFVNAHEGIAIVRQGGPYTHATYLRTVLRIVVNHPLAGATLTRLLASAGRARIAIDRPGGSQYIGICSHEGCDVDLYATENAATVTCWKCRQVHDVASRRRVLIRALDDALATATEIGRAVQVAGNAVKPATIWQWRRRGRIEVRGVTAQGAPLYRIGDVLALAGMQSTSR
jgi:hypothetical protein